MCTFEPSRLLNCHNSACPFSRNFLKHPARIQRRIYGYATGKGGRSFGSKRHWVLPFTTQRSALKFARRSCSREALSTWLNNG